MKRKIALASYIDLTIEKTDRENVVKRIIDSTFMKTEEEYNLNNIKQRNELGYDKWHQVVNDEIHTRAEGNGIQWKEVAKIDGDKLYMTRIWKENDNEKNCVQIFVKYN